MKKIRLYMDYNSSGLWDEQEFGYLKIDSIIENPSHYLQYLLHTWRETYNWQIDWSDPMRDVELPTKFYDTLSYLEREVRQQLLIECSELEIVN